jgi:hypothetical protein
VKTFFTKMNRIMSDWRAVELKIVPRLLRAKGDRTYERYTIKGYYEGGKRCQRIFRTRKEAESLLQLLQRERRHHGLSATEMPIRLRVEAHQCLKKLERHGATLSQATDFYLAHLEDKNRLQKCQNMAFYLDESGLDKHGPQQHCRSGDSNGQRDHNGKIATLYAAQRMGKYHDKHRHKSCPLIKSLDI